MTESTRPEHQHSEPSRRDRLRPLELVGFSGVLAVFAGLVVLLVLRTTDGVPDFAKAGIAAGIVFIVALLTVALVGLGGKPSDEDIEARKDLQVPNSLDSQGSGSTDAKASGPTDAQGQSNPDKEGWH